jgi:preprotein translocase SecE subunit
VARQTKSNTISDDSDSLVRVFFRGFFWPVRFIGKGLAWVSHQPPLKQIGHGLRWFFRLKPVRFIGRMLGFSFMRGSWQELRLVTWPTKHEGRRLTTAVVLFSVVFGALIAVVDYGLDKLFKQLLLK